MLDWLFKPSCPCDPQAKAWVERRLIWLDEQFPRNVFRGAPLILPSAEYFPERFSKDRAFVERLVRRVAAFMGVDLGPIRIQIEKLDPNVGFVNERGQALPSAAGLYQPGDERVITLCESQLDAPEALVGTIAHELAHELLLGEYRLTGDEFDNELLTDLTVVHLGLGVLHANWPRNWPAHQKRWPNSRLSKPEYVTPPMFGYALGHIAWQAGQRRPEWRAHLGPSVRADFDQAVRFLLATNDSRFRPPCPNEAEIE